MTRKTYFFEGCSWFKFNNSRLAPGMTLKFYTSVTKDLKLKVRKFWRLIPTFVEVTWEKLVGGFRPILNRVKVKQAEVARVNQFLFQNVQNNEIFEISKMFKNNRWINVYYTKKQTLVVYWTGCFVLLYPFWVNLVQKLKIVSLNWNLVLRIISIRRIQW